MGYMTYPRNTLKPQSNVDGLPARCLDCAGIRTYEGPWAGARLVLRHNLDCPATQLR
jgi:hypothetical protein